MTDPIHSSSGTPGTYWTTANVGEAMPGVLTPFTWSVWRGTLDRGMREGAYLLGALSAAERDDDREMIVDVFYGRVAVRVSFFATLGDRMPGVRSEDIIRTYFGEVPADLTLRPTKRRWPVVAWRIPSSFARQAGIARRFAAGHDVWWRTQVAALDGLDLAGGRRALAEALERHRAAVAMQCVTTLVAIQPAYDALTQLVAKAPGADLSALSAVPGGPELEVVADLWRASRHELSLDEVVARHGFHGPNEGEARSRVWREDPAPLRDLIRRYTERPDDESPIAADARRRAARPTLEREFLAQLPAPLRPAGRGILALVRARIPLRGLAKRSMLQSLDAARGAARVIGRELAATGALAEADDVFFLTAAELLEPPPDLRALVTRRREQHAEYSSFDLPRTWSATPTPRPREAVSDESALVTGAGVSAGTVEGIARVLLDPDFDTMIDGEILVAPVTDPSWCAAMFLAGGLVVDVGGALSHAAVVARELGLPCVVNTVDGTRRIRTGDRLRLDGRTGAVHILHRAETASDAEEQP